MERQMQPLLENFAKPIEHLKRHWVGTLFYASVSATSSQEVFHRITRTQISNSRKNKSQNPGINLSASQHKDYSHTYNTRINTKSSTKDLSLPPFNLMISWHQSLSIGNQLMKSEQVYFFSRNSVSGMQHCLVSQDSDLEAFSRNLTHGSFAAMAFQPAAFTNYANQVFLSY